MKPVFKIDIFSSGNDASIREYLKEEEIEIIKKREGSFYQQERQFVYGYSDSGHAVALIHINGVEKIPFGVLSQDIIKKQLPLVIFVENTEEAKETFSYYQEFLLNANASIEQQFDVCSFFLEKANVKIIHDIGLLKTAIQDVYKTYLNIPESVRTVRVESMVPTQEETNLARQFFSKKSGLENCKMADQNNEFHDYQQEKKLPIAAFYGASEPGDPLIYECAVELSGKYNVLYGFGGGKINPSGSLLPIEKQTSMYQFALRARQSGCEVFGTIPVAQIKYEKNCDFSALEISACLITPELQERMVAFKNSELFIVGASGTGTYEEVLDTLREKPTQPMVIFPKGNQSLINYLEATGKFPNVFSVNSREEFRGVIDKLQTLHFSEQANTLTTTGFFSNSKKSSNVEKLASMTRLPNNS